MDVAEELGQQPVARHGEPYARLSQLKYQDRRDHSHHGTKQHNQSNPPQHATAGNQRKLLERIHHRRSVVNHRLPWHESGQRHRHSDIKQRADYECGDDPNRYIALRITRFFGCSRYRIESDVCKEDDGAAS